jgi:hypothetical protein
MVTSICRGDWQEFFRVAMSRFDAFHISLAICGATAGNALYYVFYAHIDADGCSPETPEKMDRIGPAHFLG